jgi:hypothetical protein
VDIRDKTGKLGNWNRIMADISRDDINRKIDDFIFSDGG